MLETLDELEQMQAELARRKLKVFVKEAWHLVETKEPFVDNWHIDELCKALEAVTRGEITDLLINVSPGSMKSLLVSVLWPAWEWATDPSLKYLAASYSSHLSIRDNMRLRDVVTSAWYQARWPEVKLADDQTAKQYYMTTTGGWRFATSVGGAGTGEHPDRAIIDDPTTADQARSDAERQAANDWLDRTISTRGVARGVRKVIVMQRLHEQDMSGHVLAKGGYTHICWPMRYDPSRPDPRDPRREAGELFWPKLFTEAKVRSLEIGLGQFGAAGQLQQRPEPEGGGLFKKEWFTIVDEVPAGGRECRGWDTASTPGGGDWTCGVKIKGPIAGIFYVVHVERGQWGPADVDKNIKNTAQMDGRACSIREEKEGGSAGKAVIVARTQALAGFDYKGVPISGDKSTRAKPFRAQCEAGNVKLKRGAWNSLYLDELSVFPVGTHDDQVDGSSCSFNELTGGPKAIRTMEVSIG